MLFKLTGAPATFQYYINNTLREFLDVFYTAYLDDILIYSASLREHKKYVRKVLERLQETGLQVDISKCMFHADEVPYLRIIVGKNGVRIDPEKVKTVKE